MTEEWSRVADKDGQVFIFAEAGEGPLVVFLHGFPDTPHAWERIAPAVAAGGYRAVWPWLRGYHPETTVEGMPYDTLTISSDPIRFLDALGEPEAILVGHDWGALITYGAATLHPDRVRAIVPIAIPHPSLLPRTPAGFWAARHFVGLKMPWADWTMRRSDFAHVERLYRRWARNWDGPERERSIAEAKRAFADARSLKGALDYYRALSFRPAPALERPPKIRGLVVGGTVDLIDSGAFQQTAQALGEGSEFLIVEGAGHWAHREGEDEFIARLIAFLAER